MPAEMIDRHGAVSREVAAALAEGIRYRCESTLGVGITGVAGPAGGTPERPVGLVFSRGRERSREPTWCSAISPANANAYAASRRPWRWTWRERS